MIQAPIRFVVPPGPLRHLRGRFEESGRVDNHVIEIMRSYDEDLNHMSVRRFFRLVAGEPGLAVTRVELRPAKFRWLAPLTRVPVIRELVTGFVVCRLERT